MHPPDTALPVLVVGAGIMGTGIAQVAALAGHTVRLFDARDAAAEQAVQSLRATFETLVGKGRLERDAAQAALARVAAAATLDDAADAGLVVEAIVEDLEAKRGLLRSLEARVRPDCILASNTSSISITALARGLERPQRVVGMHFFNPVALMKLVEVVSGLQTDAAVAARVFELAGRWGKVAVHARSTPGFIVNRIARPYYAEALALLHERAASPAALDACARGAGFRMGPCELMDLIGHDTNFAVTESVFAAHFGDRRYAPSPVQRELVEGGLLGRKAGRGFYVHPAAAPAPPAAPAEAGPGALPAAGHLVLHGSGGVVERWAEALAAAGRPFERERHGAWAGLVVDGAQLRLTDGRPAAQVALHERVRDVALFDLPGVTVAPQGGAALAWAASAGASAAWRAQVPAWLAAAGWRAQAVEDAAGLVVARTVAMLINEASDAVLQGVCSPEAADLAMTLGLNYPAGPFEWLARWNAPDAVRLLDHLDAAYRGERYRASPALRQRAWAAATPP